MSLKLRERGGGFGLERLLAWAGLLERRRAAGDEWRRGVSLALREQRAGERDLRLGDAPVGCGETARACVERRAQERLRFGGAAAIDHQAAARDVQLDDRRVIGRRLRPLEHQRRAE